MTDRHDAILAFVAEAAALKDTYRSAQTRHGHPESVAAHSWGLCLLILLMEPEMEGIDTIKLLKLAILHDLGEAISGDIPAIYQDPNIDKSVDERRDFEALIAGLPQDLSSEFLALWDEYETGETREAVLAKGLDKIETMTQHVSGTQVPDFDYLWNLGYGVGRTNKTALLRELRAKVDDLTRRADQAR